MADPSEIDAALIAKLKANAALVSLMAFTAPDGSVSDIVYFDVAPPGIDRFVLVSLVIGEDEDVFGEVDAGIQTNLYLVKSVDKATSGSTVKTGAKLIHEALQKQPLSITGYSHMHTLRRERVRYTEVDEDSGVRWQHRGGRYEVMASSNG